STPNLRPLAVATALHLRDELSGPNGLRLWAMSCRFAVNQGQSGKKEGPVRQDELSPQMKDSLASLRASHSHTLHVFGRPSRLARSLVLSRPCKPSPWQRRGGWGRTMRKANEHRRIRGERRLVHRRPGRTDHPTSGASGLRRDRGSPWTAAGVNGGTVSALRR